jgi:hypothetical protein
VQIPSHCTTENIKRQEEIQAKKENYKSKEKKYKK